jgi:uncharacterized protein involved in exopolysaccharide biosynthesis
MADKLDVGKYFNILRRRKWWGIIPFCVLVIAFGIVCLAMPPKYVSTSILMASKSGVAELYGVGQTKASKIRTSRSIVSEEMKRYDQVMQALAGTEVMEEIESKVEDDPASGPRLKEELYRRIKKNIHIGSMGRVLIRVSYLGESPDRAFKVLTQLVNNFVENALAQERKDAKDARDLAADELTRAQEALERFESRIARFSREHPAVTSQYEGGPRHQFYETKERLEELERTINAMRRQRDRLVEQIEKEPKRVVDTVKTTVSPEVQVLQTRLAELRNQLAIARRTFTALHPRVKELGMQIRATEDQLARAQGEAGQDEISLTPNKLRERLEEKKLDLETQLDYQLETQRNLQIEKARLEQEVHALPGLQREYARLKREKSAAEGVYQSALKRFKRIDKQYKTTMEGLVSFSVFSPPRKSHQKDVRHKIKLAMMGIFVSVAAGVGAIAGTEFLDQSFTDVEVARDFLRLPSLGAIPVIQTQRDRRRRWLLLLIIGGVALALLVTLLLSVLFVPPVRQTANDLWYLIRQASKGIM